MGNYFTITNNRSDKQEWQGRPWKFLDPFNTWTVYKLLLQTKMSQYNTLYETKTDRKKSHHKDDDAFIF